jgi:hypothetical protein
VALAKSSGLSDAEIARVRAGYGGGEWSAFDRTLLRAADELIDFYTLSDTTWQALTERYDKRQMIEVPVVVGVYYSMGTALNSFGVEIEPELAQSDVGGREPTRTADRPTGSIN